ncbi:HAD family hydrolase [Cohnella lubricantis]|uniref:HAD family hydrolase n=1 Tax=Cohnella lubricantis TaxID=2163172 RepID=A0A841T9S0_9BACL|nr:HAD family hydrolase [Cohnella lubricantis]MBB6676168.1 HAD family hydrolase [Cohnella lubricantis]MBP2118639.1 putative hydrolase of the HAD superfamily [Cohnella lubricantis]
MKQNILFDLDDTLIYCNKYFNLVSDQFADMMTDWFSPFGVTREELASKHLEIDIAGVKIHGFKSDHFPQSFVETYRYYSKLTGRSMSPKEEKLLWELGMSVYDHEVEPYPAMNETLDSLVQDGHQLHLYTGGDIAVQQRKIERMNLERYFQDRIYIRMHKNTDALKGILNDGRFDKNHTWMIGNSLRTDVLPALECGLHAIYLKREDEWKFNILNVDTPPRGALLTLTELADVPPAIDEYLVKAKEPGV